MKLDNADRDGCGACGHGNGRRGIRGYKGECRLEK